jgi:hypothetical protein
LHLIIAGIGQQTRDQRPDFSGAQNQYAMHADFQPKGWRILPIPLYINHPLRRLVFALQRIRVRWLCR